MTGTIFRVEFNFKPPWWSVANVMTSWMVHDESLSPHFTVYVCVCTYIHLYKYVAWANEMKSYKLISFFFFQ